MEKFDVGDKEAVGWEPSQNVAFMIIVAVMVLGGVLVFLL